MLALQQLQNNYPITNLHLKPRDKSCYFKPVSINPDFLTIKIAYTAFISLLFRICHTFPLQV